MKLTIFILFFSLFFLGCTKISGYSYPMSCNNLSLSDTVSCVVSDTKTFYKYNLTSDKISLTLEQLKERGGDCKDWSDYYINVFKELGFDAQFVDFPTGDSWHAVAIVTSNNGYCLVDQQYFKCYDLPDN